MKRYVIFLILVIASFSSYSQSTSKIVVGLSRPEAQLIIADLYERDYLLQENARMDSLVTLLQVNIEMYELALEKSIENEKAYEDVISNLHQVIEIHEFDLNQNKKRIRNLKIQNIGLKAAIGIGAAVLVKTLLFN